MLTCAGDKRPLTKGFTLIFCRQTQLIFRHLIKTKLRGTQSRTSTVIGGNERELLSRPKIGLHELTCKHDEKIDKNYSRTGSYHC